VLQVGKPGSAIRLPFDEFQAIDVPFHRCTDYLAHLFGKSHNESERTLCWLLGHPFKKSLLDHNNYAFQAHFLRTDGPCSQHTFSLFGPKTHDLRNEM